MKHRCRVNNHDRCACGGLWIGGACSRCGALCNCTICRHGRAETKRGYIGDLERLRRGIYGIGEKETEALVSRIAAAYVRDRSEQYIPSSGIYTALCELAAKFDEDAHMTAFRHSELDDLLKKRGDPLSKVTAIKIEMVVDGKRREMMFLRPEKIEELLWAEDSVGSFLRSFRDSAPDKRGGK